MPEEEKFKFKICLVGEGAVGKTSLIRRYVFDEFKDSYISTIGTKITKRDLKIKHPIKGEDVDISVVIWDIMGQKGFRQLLQEAYFYGAQGVIAVCDITSRNSLNDLPGWVEAAFTVTGQMPVAFMANKYDLKDKADFDYDELKELASKYEKTMVFQSSAKTGQSVNEAFEKLCLEILKES